MQLEPWPSLASHASIYGLFGDAFVNDAGASGSARKCVTRDGLGRPMHQCKGFQNTDLDQSGHDAQRAV
jgi:hypothetical protein